ncbi:MAG: hypothetical protein UY04_C0021G0009 [Parcubacteria group bacterium GW2011_GWA2_47_7]|nr:MAG: hypothetical protein UY04_C0021G0009 [Parcubacteria group bacterium GW2011_GWA2_47_7]
MQKSFPIWFLALVVSVLAVVDIVARPKHLYFYIWWLDIPMHLIGGFWVGLIVLTYYFAYQYKFPKRESSHFALFLSVGGAFVVALSWEVFEWSVDWVNGLIHNDMIDSLSDICNGVIGASVGTALFVWRGYNKST